MIKFLFDVLAPNRLATTSRHQFVRKYEKLKEKIGVRPRYYGTNIDPKINEREIAETLEGLKKLAEARDIEREAEDIERGKLKLEKNSAQKNVDSMPPPSHI